MNLPHHFLLAHQMTRGQPKHIVQPGRFPPRSDLLKWSPLSGQANLFCVPTPTSTLRVTVVTDVFSILLPFLN